MIAASQTQHVRGHVIFSFEEDVAGSGEVRHEPAIHVSGGDAPEDLPDGQELEQQEAAEMKVPVTPTEEEIRYHNLTHYPYREWCQHCVLGRGRDDKHTKRVEREQEGTPGIQLDYSFLTDGETQVPLLAAIDNVYHRTLAVWIPLKGADAYVAKCIKTYVQSLGFPRGIIQSDSEHSALAVSKLAIETVDGWTTRQTP
eukprot:4705949-Amphidinium_carterae.1